MIIGQQARRWTFRFRSCATHATAMVAIIVVLATLAVITAHAQTYTVLYSFTGGQDGASPYAGLIRGPAGNFYGTTMSGGAYDKGVVFRLNPNTGVLDVLYAFGVDELDGFVPRAGLVRDQAGALYGTTALGGSHAGSDPPFHDGTVFKLTPNADGTWTETRLHDFSGSPDGAYPLARLVRDASGNLYGTSRWGGDSGGGSLFELSPQPDGTWGETILGSTYNGPVAGVVRDEGGNLYGVTAFGGAYDHGSVYRWHPTTGKLKTVHSFTGSDGIQPLGELLIQGHPATCTLYGTTAYGGSHGMGTVFKLKHNLNRTWTFTSLYSFTGGIDGAQPNGALLRDTAGNLYGTTSGGGANSAGAVFKLSPSAGGWKETVLHSFNGQDGSGPFSTLTWDPAGNLYGTTLGGGAYDSGVVFKLVP